MLTDKTFIGIDLAWQPDKNPSGVAVIREHDGRAELVAAESLKGAEAVREFIARYADSTTAIAIDAPLIVINPNGRRECENELSRRYGAAHASCHSTSLKTFGGKLPASAVLAEWLAAQYGFVHAPVATETAKVMMEVYPHAAFVALRERDRIIKYKKGTVSEKVAGLFEVQYELGAIFAGDVPVLSNALSEELFSREPTLLVGASRKSFEDELDAVLCAYVAYRYAKLSADQFDVFGDAVTGYIVNPKRAAPGSTVGHRRSFKEWMADWDEDVYSHQLDDIMKEYMVGIDDTDLDELIDSRSEEPTKKERR